MQLPRQDFGFRASKVCDLWVYQGLGCGVSGSGLLDFGFRAAKRFWAPGLYRLPPAALGNSHVDWDCPHIVLEWFWTTGTRRLGFLDPCGSAIPVNTVFCAQVLQFQGITKNPSLFQLKGLTCHCSQRTPRRRCNSLEDSVIKVDSR